MGAVGLGLLFVVLLGPLIWLPSLLDWQFRKRSLQHRALAATLGEQSARWVYVGVGGLVTLIGCGFIATGTLGLVRGETPSRSHVPGRAELPELSPLRTLEKISSSNQAILFTPDSTRLVTAGNKLQVWNLQTGSLEQDIALPKSPVAGSAYQAKCLATSQTQIVIGLIGLDAARTSAVGLWDMENPNEPISAIEIPIALTHVAVSADGRYAIAMETHAFGSDTARREQRPVILVDSEEKTVHELNAAGVNAVAFGGQEQEFWLASANGFQLLDVTTQEVLRTVKAPMDSEWNGCLDFSISADGNHALACDRQSLWLWDLAAGKLVQRLPTPEKFVTEIDLADNGTFLTRGFVDDGALGVWQLPKLEPRKVLIPNTDGQPYTCIAISPNGQYAAGLQRRSCLIWQLED